MRSSSIPPLPFLRLCQDAIRHLEVPDDQLSGHCGVKREWQTASACPGGPILLRHVYLLEETRGSSPPTGIRPLRGGEAVQALVAQSYQRDFAQAILGLSGHFAACAEVAAKVEVHRLIRPLQFHLQERLLDHLAHTWSP